MRHIHLTSSGRSARGRTSKESQAYSGTRRLVPINTHRPIGRRVGVPVAMPTCGDLSGSNRSISVYNRPMPKARYSDAGDRFILFSSEIPSFHHVETSLEAIGGGVFSDGLHSEPHDTTTEPSRPLEHQLNPRQRTGRDWPPKATSRQLGLPHATRVLLLYDR